MSSGRRAGARRRSPRRRARHAAASIPAATRAGLDGTRLPVRQRRRACRCRSPTIRLGRWEWAGGKKPLSRAPPWPGRRNGGSGRRPALSRAPPWPARARVGRAPDRGRRHLRARSRPWPVDAASVPLSPLVPFARGRGWFLREFLVSTAEALSRARPWLEPPQVRRWRPTATFLPARARGRYVDGAPLRRGEHTASHRCTGEDPPERSHRERGFDDPGRSLSAGPGRTTRSSHPVATAAACRAARHDRAGGRPRASSAPASRLPPTAASPHAACARARGPRSSGRRRAISPRPPAATRSARAALRGRPSSRGVPGTGFHGCSRRRPAVATAARIGLVPRCRTIVVAPAERTVGARPGGPRQGCPATGRSRKGQPRLAGGEAAP